MTYLAVYPCINAGVCIISLRRPGVKINQRGTHAPLRDRFSFVVKPPRSDRARCVLSTFFSGHPLHKNEPEPSSNPRGLQRFQPQRENVHGVLQRHPHHTIYPTGDRGYSNIHRPAARHARRHPLYLSKARPRENVYRLRDPQHRCEDKTGETARCSPRCITDNMGKVLRCICFWMFHEHIIPQSIPKINAC